MNKLGVLVTCYNEVQAVEYSLTVFRQLYPDVKIYLTTESNSSDYSRLLKLNNISINHVADTMYFIRHITDQNFTTPHFQNKMIVATTAFLQRVVRAIQYCQSEYLLLMDPDTLVRGHLNIPDGVKLLGTRINQGLPIELRKVLLQVPGAIDIDCWGATPAIIHTQTFLKSHKYVTESDPTFLSRIAQTFYAIYAHDVILPILFALQGEKETFNPDIIECNREWYWHLTSHPLVHQFKYLYDNNSDRIVQH